MPTKQEKERAFHNETFSSNARASASAFYNVLNASRHYFEAALFADVAGKDVLEYGCGMGTYSFTLAAKGARVTGIDISDVAIEQAAAEAARQNLPIRYTRMDAERLEFPDASFDIVCGVAILHHLDLDKAYGSLSRVLRPGGRAVFMEPLGHNPAINLYRRLTPKLRTEDEHPLLMRDLDVARRYFGRVDNRFFTMHTLLATPFHRARSFRKMLDTLDAVDALAFRICPPLRRYAWQTIIVVSEPLHGRRPAR